MKTLINIVLMLAAVGLAYLLYSGISEPIRFESEWSSREKAVSDKLKNVRDAQKAFKGITGQYAPNFDTLALVLKTSEFKIKSIYGDPDDPTGNAIREEIVTVSSIDSMNRLGINLDSLRYVPCADCSEPLEFTTEAYVINYQKTKVPVVQVSVPVKAYMGQFAHPRFKRYNNTYEPDALLKFGDLSKPNLAGNWRDQTKDDKD